MTIYTDGALNPAALGVPGLFVNVQAPPAAPLPGAPSNILGIVGTSNWGPKNSPVIAGDEAMAADAFGPMQARKYDLTTAVHAAMMNGCNNFRLVRVTDGTDVAASVIILTNCLTVTARYTGSRGNTIDVATGPGTAPSTWKVTISMPGKQPEVFDNIPGAANAAWVNIAAAINNGQSTIRPASDLVVASAGVGTTAVATASYDLASGTDGVTTINSTVLIGADTNDGRTGMYALRDTGISVFMLADCDTSASWSTQAAFGKSEMAYCIAVGPAGDTISNHTTVINTAGIDEPWIKVLFGDWTYMVDGVNKITRLVSPQGFVAGRKVNIGPHNSLLNKPLYGIAGTQKSAANKVYSSAELQAIGAARTDVIAMNSPGGNYPSCRFGRNSSSDVGRRQDTYTGLTSYLARSFDAPGGSGQFIGRLMSPDQMREAKNQIEAFLENERAAGRIVNFSVQLDATNNPPSSTNIGVQKARVMVEYADVIEYFIIDFTGGQTVQIERELPVAA